MTKPYTLVVFDWEGTLADTLGLIIQIVGKVAEELGYERPDETKARSYASYGLVSAIEKLYPELSDEQHRTLIQKVQIALSMPHDNVFIMSGALDCIKQLRQRGVDLAIATNKGERSLHKALSMSGLDNFFSVTRSAGQTALKPDPQMLQEILELTGARVENALMIGDTPTDIEMANRVCMDAIGVDFYQQQKDALLDKGAMAVFDNYEEVTKYILQQP